MDKVKKLRRYSRKDYTQVVDFPVEIVGRDGVVRCYSFEASIRLYQRRIASAASRYDDTEVVSAEVQHCRMRIEQLRKSYFHRYGWAALQQPGAGSVTGALAGEVAAFLRRFHGPSEPEQLQVRWIADFEHGRTCFVRREERSFVLYLYEFSDFGPCPEREAFFDFLRLLQGAKGQDVEALIAFHHTADCGLVLTCMGEHAAAAPALASGDQDDEAGLVQIFDSPTDDAYAEGLRMLSAGEPIKALDRFEEAYRLNPWRRKVGLAVCVVGEMLGRPERAETAARMARHHFPDDALFSYHLGLALLRQGRFEEAQGCCEDALRQRSGFVPARIMLGLLELRVRRWRNAERELGAALGAPSEAPGEPDEFLLRLLRSLRARRRLLGVGVALWVLALPLLIWLPGLAVCFVILGGVGVGLAWLLARRMWSSSGSDEALRRLRLVNPETLGRGRQLEVHLT